MLKQLEYSQHISGNQHELTCNSFTEGYNILREFKLSARWLLYCLLFRSPLPFGDFLLKE